MPEGDSVARLSRRLQPLVGRTIEHSDFRVPHLATVDLTGTVITRVWPHGKHLFWACGDLVLHTHLRMESNWRIQPVGTVVLAEATGPKGMMTGEQVFDATVAGGHNFIANGIAVHNSIEQDADMVILLHRDEAYDRETPRKGEADFIIAKHRNGPTDTIVVAFQGHYARFVDMAQDTGGGGAW